MWAHIKLLCHIGKLNGTDIDDNSEDGIRDVIKNAFTRTATIVDILYKCSAKNIQEVVVKSLYEFSAAEDRFQNTTSSLDKTTVGIQDECISKSENNNPQTDGHATWQTSQPFRES